MKVKKYKHSKPTSTNTDNLTEKEKNRWAALIFATFKIGQKEIKYNIDSEDIDIGGVELIKFIDMMEEELESLPNGVFHKNIGGFQQTAKKLRI